jgi:hypothetical protein
VILFTGTTRRRLFGIGHFPYSYLVALSISAPGTARNAGATNTVTDTHRGRVVASALLLSLCAAFTACHRVFVSMANYDDEGYMTWTVKNFLGGQALYDQVATVYGPFYYLYEWCILSMTGFPAAADTLRLVSAGFWVAAALMAFALVYWATGSLVLAICVHLLVFRALRFIGEEPAHPQEACIFLLLALGYVFYVANRTLRMVMIGALAGAIACTKINLGIFVLVALTVGLCFAQPPGRWRSSAGVAVSLGAMALPAVLMWDRRAEAWAVSYCILVVLSLASALLTVWGIPWKGGLALGDAAVVAGVFAGTTVAICCFPLAYGSSLHSLFEWLIVMARIWSQSWSRPANIQSAALVWAVVGSFLPGTWANAGSRTDGCPWSSSRLARPSS